MFEVRKGLMMLAFGLTALAVLFYIVSTSTTSWVTYDLPSISTQANAGLWRACLVGKNNGVSVEICGDIGTKGQGAYVIANRFTTIVSILLTVPALIIAILVYLKIVEMKLMMYVAAGTIIGAGVLNFIGSMWYVGEAKSDYDDVNFGFSIILLWLAIPMAFFGGIVMILITSGSVAE
ncbi:uncharacterized protein LOC144432747 [Glandiceps talaboti]